MGYLNDRGHEKKHELLEQLFNQYSRSMYYVAYNILHDAYLAEDAVQTTFLKLEKNKFRIDTIVCNKTKAFMVIVIRNVSLELLKSKKRDAAKCENDEFIDIPDDSLLPLDVLIKNESIEEIKEAMGALDQKYSDVLLMRYFSDYSISEIASLFNASEQLVRVRLHRAKKQLIVELNERKRSHE